MNCLVSVIDIRFSSKSTVTLWYLHLGPNFTNQQRLESIKPSDLLGFFLLCFEEVHACLWAKWKTVRQS